MGKASTSSGEATSTISSPPTAGGVVVDIGTGDGRFVYRSARSNPDRFYIGIDVERRALAKVSEKIHRRPERGGLPNVLFVQAPAEDLPHELDGSADEIHVHFPWGSLLRSVAVGDKRVLAGLRRIAAPGAWLEVLIGIDDPRDLGELRRLGIPPITETSVASELIPRYRRAGFEAFESGIVPSSRWPHLETTWARRLRSGRRMLFLIAHAP